MWPFPRKQRPPKPVEEPKPLTKDVLKKADDDLESLLGVLGGLKLLDEERKDMLRSTAERMLFEEATRTLRHAIRP